MTWVIYVIPFALPWWELRLGNFNYGPMLALGPGALLIAVLAPLVSYRRIDGLYVLVPIVGLILIWKIGARLAKLPHRDWPLRPEEQDMSAHRSAEHGP